jgi:hypothetical protein
MERSPGSDKLVCQHGYVRWADFQLCRMESGGYGLVVPCELGDHWLGPERNVPGRYTVGLEAVTWPTILEAFAAREAWCMQQQGQ